MWYHSWAYLAGLSEGLRDGSAKAGGISAISAIFCSCNSFS